MKTKAQLNQESRERKKKNGLVPFYKWMTPLQKQLLVEYLKELNNKEIIS